MGGRAIKQTPLRRAANLCRVGLKLARVALRGSELLTPEGDGNVAVMKQLSVMLENKRGALAELCSELAKVAVNILALSVPEQAGVAPVRLVVNGVDAAKKVFDGLGAKHTEEDVIAARVSDRPGALGKLTRKLADHNIDVRYAYGSILKGAGAAVVILAVSDVDAAAKIVK
jgi:hypothetical protein